MILIKSTLAIILIISIGILLITGKYKAFEKFFLLIISSILLAFIISPQLSDVIANFFGIEKGKDLIIYIAIAILWFFYVISYVKIKKLERDVTLIVRKNALENYRLT